MSDQLETLLELVNSPRDATLPISRYQRVIWTMRGAYVGLEGKYDLLLGEIEREMKGRGKTEGLYFAARVSITMAFNQAVKTGLSESGAYELLLWPLKDAYSGFLVELERQQ